MNQDELKSELATLHQQLQELLDSQDQLDEETAGSLRQVASDIALLQEKSAENSPVEKPQTLDPNSLEAMALGFEVEHPQLADMLKRFNVLLGNMGI